MSEAAIRALIEPRVKSFADAQDMPVAWENVPFTPPDDAAYLRFFLLPGQSRSDDLACQITSFVGVAQIDVAVPSGGGPGAAEALVKGLRAQFPASLRLSDGTVTMIVMTPLSAAPSIPDESHYIIPTSFSYRADV